MDDINDGRTTPILVCQVRYLNNVVEQDHRFIERITKPMMNFKSFGSARNALAGIELMRMFRRGQCDFEGAENKSFAQQFYALAGQLRRVCTRSHCAEKNDDLISLTRQNPRQLLISSRIYVNQKSKQGYALEIKAAANLAKI